MKSNIIFKEIKLSDLVKAETREGFTRITYSFELTEEIGRELSAKEIEKEAFNFLEMYMYIIAEHNILIGDAIGNYKFEDTNIASLGDTLSLITKINRAVCNEMSRINSLREKRRSNGQKLILRLKDDDADDAEREALFDSFIAPESAPDYIATSWREPKKPKRTPTAKTAAKSKTFTAPTVSDIPHSKPSRKSK